VICMEPNGKCQENKLLLFGTSDHALRTTIPLWKAQLKEGERSITGRPALSPNGKWFAVVSGSVPPVPPGGTLDVHDAPQPRIFLIDTTSGAIRDTLIPPPTLGRGACFSPDGRLLATSGHGRVLLWDVADLTDSPTGRRP